MKKRLKKLSKLRLIAILLLTNLVLFSCSPSSPRGMASEYCSCINKAFENDVPDIKKLNDCADMALRHTKKLADDIEAAKIYADEIVSCGLHGKTSIDR